MTMTYEMDPDRVKRNHYTPNIYVKGRFVQKILPEHTHTHTHTVDRLYYTAAKVAR